MTDTLEAFRRYREKMNAAILAAGNLEINRFFALDTRSYAATTASPTTSCAVARRA
jgi:hypothetical protein